MKSLLVKLTVYKYIVHIFTLGYFLISVPICIPSVMGSLGFMLFHSTYAMLSGNITSIPLVAIFNRFIIPGTEQCISIERSLKAENSFEITNKTLNPATDI
eukprot:snap_masked-scaffold_45-processed-gene-1.68-mRNA-1 protein AED:1.00 eAED:1.00 QI:0/0/0/0/1/1/2/0/100